MIDVSYVFLIKLKLKKIGKNLAGALVCCEGLFFATVVQYSLLKDTFSQLYASKHTVVMEPGSVRSCAFVVISWIAIASLASCFSVDDTKDGEFKVRSGYTLF